MKLFQNSTLKSRDVGVGEVMARFKIREVTSFVENHPIISPHRLPV